MKPRPSTLAIAGLLTAVTLAITGCGNGSGSNSNPIGGGGTSQPRPRSVDPAQMKTIQKCLKAAGLNSSIPEGAPSGMPNDLPTGLPSNLPSGAPTDVPSNFSGGPGGQFDNPEIQAALEACGIQLPTPPGG